MEVRPDLLEKNNEMALQRADMRMVRWMCNVKVKEFQLKSWETKIR